MKQETLALETSSIIHAIKMKWLTMTVSVFLLAAAHSFDPFMELCGARSRQDKHIERHLLRRQQQLNCKSMASVAYSHCKSVATDIVLLQAADEWLLTDGQYLTLSIDTEVAS